LQRKGLEVIADLIAYTPERREPDFFAAFDCRRIVEASMDTVRMTGIDRESGRVDLTEQRRTSGGNTAAPRTSVQEETR